jgi:hypothetical protein
MLSGADRAAAVIVEWHGAKVDKPVSEYEPSVTNVCPRACGGEAELLPVEVADPRICA